MKGLNLDYADLLSDVSANSSLKGELVKFAREIAVNHKIDVYDWSHKELADKINAEAVVALSQVLGEL